MLAKKVGWSEDGETKRKLTCILYPYLSGPFERENLSSVVLEMIYKDISEGNSAIRSGRDHFLELARGCPWFEAIRGEQAQRTVMGRLMDDIHLF